MKLRFVAVGRIGGYYSQTPDMGFFIITRHITVLLSCEAMGRRNRGRGINLCTFRRVTYRTP